MTPRLKNISFGPATQRHSELREDKSHLVIDPREVLREQTKGLVSKGAPLRLLTSAAAILKAIDSNSALNLN